MHWFLSVHAGFSISVVYKRAIKERCDIPEPETKKAVLTQLAQNGVIRCNVPQENR